MYYKTWTRTLEQCTLSKQPPPASCVLPNLTINNWQTWQLTWRNGDCPAWHRISVTVNRSASVCKPPVTTWNYFIYKHPEAKLDSNGCQLSLKIDSKLIQPRPWPGCIEKYIDWWLNIVRVGRVTKSSIMMMLTYHHHTCRLWNLVARSLAHIGAIRTNPLIFDAIERSENPGELTGRLPPL